MTYGETLSGQLKWSKKRMNVNTVWCVRDMRSNVRTVCMFYIVYATTILH